MALWYLVQSSGLRMSHATATTRPILAVLPADSEELVAAKVAQQAIDSAWESMRVPRLLEPMEVHQQMHEKILTLLRPIF